jgi:hypothetical protein
MQEKQDRENQKIQDNEYGFLAAKGHKIRSQPGVRRK